MGGRSATRALAAAVVLAAGGLAALTAGCSDQRLVPIHAIGGARPDGGAGACPDQQIGFATQGSGTTGGAAGATVTVDNATDLQTSASDEAPLTIQVSGMIALTAQVRVKTANKTIIGLGAASGLTGSGLNITDGGNVIVRNLIIEKAVGTDAITIGNARNVWIDHCELSSDRDHGKDYYDGLIDINHAADDVTVSWTQFRDHFQTSLIGHSDDNGAEDTGHLTVTYEHNLFLRTHSHNPSLRFGRLHALNNYYLTIDGGGIFSRMSAEVLAEGNYFDGVTLPLTTHFESPTDGFLTDKNNVFVNSSANQIGQTTDWTPPYAYTAQNAAEVPALVTACAGAGKLGL